MLRVLGALAVFASLAFSASKTVVMIKGDQFFINGQPTYKGRTWNGHKIEGLLLNPRMVQGIYDDANPETAKRWAYKDTGKWDAERNTREFLAAMPEWKRHGLNSFTINLQGGSPEGYSKAQPWDNTAIAADGSLKPGYMSRLKRILDKADDLNMAVILGIFYFGQDERVKDEEAVKKAVDNTVDWVMNNGYRNVLIEVNNECNVTRYEHEILKPGRIHELIERVKARTRNGQRLLVSTSYGGNKVAEENVVRSSDFILLHGNGVKDPKRISEVVRLTRAVPGYTTKPILFNEDDHFNFDQADYNMLGAIREYASWGYFDPEGYQSPPVNWGLDTERKKAFFSKLKEVTGVK